MDRLDVPFNISLLSLTPNKLQGLRPVTALDFLDGQTKNFHPNGLFSTEIFGRVGDEARSQRFSYIDIRIPIFHPVLFRALSELKRLYAGIMAGSDYAIWNAEAKDFEKSNPLEGQTGYAFFLKHWRDIVFEETKSAAREQNILLIKKYGDNCMTDKIVVMPAGLRDLEMDGGRIEFDDVNGFYRKMLSVSSTLTDSAIKQNPESLNITRYNLQVTFNQLYDYLESMIRGKKKLLLGGWAARGIFNGTRNVISAMETSVPELGKPGYPDFNTTVVGLYQAAKAANPISIFHLKTGFLSKVFSTVDAPARLVNKKTLRVEEVHLKPAYYDRFMTDEGLAKVLTSFGTEDLRHKPLEIEGRWLGLIYKGPDGTYRLLQDIAEVPLDRRREDVTPITFCELLYLSIYQHVNGLPAFVTRYPVTGIGSIYPSRAMIQPTIKTEVRRELDQNWQPMDDTHVAYKFPVTGSAFINSTIPHSSKLAGLGADFDGDTASLNITYSDESKKEVDTFLKSKRAYVGVDGKFISSVSVSPIELVFHNLTSNVEG